MSKVDWVLAGPGGSSKGQEGGSLKSAACLQNTRCLLWQERGVNLI